MNDAFIVVRKAKNLEDKYWVCFGYTDSIKIANDVTQYWKDICEQEDAIIHHAKLSKISSDLLFHCGEVKHNIFSVIVKRQKINELGEN